MKTTSRNVVQLLFLLLILSSCVATSGVVNTNSIVTPGAPIAKLKTYAWYQEPQPDAAAFDKGFSEKLDKNIKQAVEEELQKKGYTKATSNPDFWVSYDVSVSVPLEKDKEGNYPTGFGYSYAYMAGYRYTYGNPNLPGYRPVDLFKEGTLIIDITNPKTDMLLWRGWAEGAISNFNANYKSVQENVTKVLEKLPAPSR